MRLIIDKLLLIQNVEKNPGPVDVSLPETNFSVRTYNSNGLGEINKLRSLLIKVKSEVKQGGIVLLQETHLNDDKVIEMHWKMSCGLRCVNNVKTSRGE